MRGRDNPAVSRYAYIMSDLAALTNTPTLLIDARNSLGEGPRWHDGRLWFSDFYSQTIRSVDLAGDHRVELTLDDQPSGLGWMPDGSMLIMLRDPWGVALQLCQRSRPFPVP